MQLESASIPATPIQSFLDDILVVLVLYRRELTVTESFASMNRSLKTCGGRLTMFVYDNSPEPMFREGDWRPHLRMHYRHDPANAGISAAYNAGARLALEMGKKWLLLLDQDTTFPPETMVTYANVVSEGGDAPMFAPQLVAGGKLLSPCGYLAGVAYHLRQVQPGSLVLHNRAVLNSGLLVQLAAFELCGGYDERVRVDFADFAFINRFRYRYSKIDVLDLVCQHGFSNLEIVPLDSALRRFSDYCRDGRAAAATPLLKITHAFLVLRRCVVLTLRYNSVRFLARLPAYFSSNQRKISS